MIKTYEEACKKLKQQSLDFTNIPAEVHSLLKLTTIIKALNAGWIPDWNKPSQYKYIIWWYWNGTAFVYSDSHDWDSNTLVGSRLCFKDRATAQYCAETFGELWNDYLQYV